MFFFLAYSGPEHIPRATTMEASLIHIGNIDHHRSDSQVTMTFIAPKYEDSTTKAAKRLYAETKNMPNTIFHAVQMLDYMATTNPDKHLEPDNFPQVTWKNEAMDQKDLESAGTVIDNIQALIQENKLHPVHALKLMQILSTYPYFDQIRKGNVKNVKSNLKSDTDVQRSPPELISLVIPEDNFIDLALQFGRGRELIRGTVATRFARAVDHQQFSHGTKPELYVRSKLQQEVKYAVPPTTRIYPKGNQDRN